jgi:hypothetical protein
MWSPPAPWPGASSHRPFELLPGPRTRAGAGLGALCAAVTLRPGEPLRALGAWGLALDGARLTLSGDALRRGVLAPTAARVRAREGAAARAREATTPLRGSLGL